MSSDFSPELRRELLEDFYAECDELLTAIRRNVSALETKSPAGGRRPEEELEPLYRAVHTLKGIAGIAGVSEAQQLAHAMEDLLRGLTRRRVTPEPAQLDLFAAGVQRLDGIIAAHRQSQPMPEFDDLVLRLREAGPVEAAPPPAPAPAGAAPRKPDPVVAARLRGLQAWRCVFAPSPVLDRRGVNLDQVRARLAELGEILDAEPAVCPNGSIEFRFTLGLRAAPADPAAWETDGLRLVRIDPTPAETPARAAGEAIEPTAALPSRLLRVDLGRLDELMRIAGELVIQRSRLHDRVQRRTDDEALKEIDAALGRSLRDLRKALTQVRLVPILEVFSRVPFIVRDLARGSDKKVRVVLEGEQTEIDKYLAERLSEPLLHLVRNALAHGIETPEERRTAGKPAEATIVLRAASVGESVEIQVADDGRGIDPGRIAARARALGIAIPEQLDAGGLLHVLSAAGFSTREQADRAAGRGIGMAVVARSVVELGGTISLATTVGRGSQFTLRLPLSLSIVEAIIVGLGDETWAVPQSAVDEICQVPATDVRAIRDTEVVPYRGGLLPIVRLAKLFGVPARPSDTLTLVVLHSERGAVGLLVDRVQGRREIVVRPLSDPLVHVRGVAGATELGDGRPILILDPLALTDGAVRPTARRAGPVPAATSP